MCVIATSSVAGPPNVRRLVVAVMAVAVAFIYYGRGQVRPEITSAAVIGVVIGSRLRSLRNNAVTAPRLAADVSCCLFVVGLLADSVDPIAFGTIEPAHIPLLPRALIHGSPAAMMHIGVLILLAIPVVQGVTALLRRFRSV